MRGLSVLNKHCVLYFYVKTATVELLNLFVADIQAFFTSYLPRSENIIATFFFLFMFVYLYAMPYFSSLLVNSQQMWVATVSTCWHAVCFRGGHIHRECHSRSPINSFYNLYWKHWKYYTRLVHVTNIKVITGEFIVACIRMLVATGDVYLYAWLH